MALERAENIELLKNKVRNFQSEFTALPEYYTKPPQNRFFNELYLFLQTIFVDKYPVTQQFKEFRSLIHEFAPNIYGDSFEWLKIFSSSAPERYRLFRDQVYKFAERLKAAATGSGSGSSGSGSGNGSGSGSGSGSGNNGDFKIPEPEQASISGTVSWVAWCLLIVGALSIFGGRKGK